MAILVVCLLDRKYSYPNFLVWQFAFWWVEARVFRNTECNGYTEESQNLVFVTLNHSLV